MIDIFKAGGELSIAELALEFDINENLIRNKITYVRKWLRKEGLFLANTGNGNTMGKYMLVNDSNVSQESSRRYSLIKNHFNNVQDLIITGIEQYKDDPSILNHLEELVLSIQESQITQRRRLLKIPNLTPYHANSNDPTPQDQARPKSTS